MIEIMCFAYGMGILLADQWSKRTMQSHAGNRNLGWGTAVRFRFAPNRNRSFERARTRVSLVLTWLLALACAVVLHRFAARFQGAVSLAGLGLAFGGAASNLLDILQRRYVVDFIHLGWWPVFNLADVAILAGLAAAFLG
jgi:lipoprotein signal peptidase